MDFPSDADQMVTDLYNANWIIIASLDLNEERPYSYALPRLLAERQDLLRNKKIILFAFGAPYYLDSTNISKTTAFFALYNKLPAAIDASARVLFKELPSFPGSLPVSVPGINYDLISATSPDPEREFAIFIGNSPESVSTTETPSSTPIAPLYHVDDLIDLHTGVILDHNGNPVPDGTPVNFILSSQGNITILPTVNTFDGSASTSFLVEEGFNIFVSAESSLARSATIEINILGNSINDNGENTSGNSTEEPDQIIDVPENTEQTESLPTENEDIAAGTWGDWGLSLFLILLVSVIAYQTGASSGLVRWGIRWSLSGLIAGLGIYNYIILELPGVVALFPNGVSRFALASSVLFASLIGWFLAYLYQRIFNA